MNTRRPESHLPLVVSFAVAGILTASLATGTAQSAVASLVQIINTSANPVPMQDMDNRARQPVTIQAGVSVTGGFPNGSATNVYQVPAGKRLVIEYINLSGDAATAEQVLTISLFSTTGPSIRVPVANLPPPENVPTFHDFVASAPVFYYVNPGDFITVGIQTNADASGVGGAQIVVTGYLVNLP